MEKSVTGKSRDGPKLGEESKYLKVKILRTYM